MWHEAKVLDHRSCLERNSRRTSKNGNITSDRTGNAGSETGEQGEIGTPQEGEVMEVEVVEEMKYDVADLVHPAMSPKNIMDCQESDGTASLRTRRSRNSDQGESNVAVTVQSTTPQQRPSIKQ